MCELRSLVAGLAWAALRTTGLPGASQVQLPNLGHLILALDCPGIQLSDPSPSHPHSHPASYSLRPGACTGIPGRRGHQPPMPIQAHPVFSQLLNWPWDVCGLHFFVSPKFSLFADKEDTFVTWSKGVSGMVSEKLEAACTAQVCWAGGGRRDPGRRDSREGGSSVREGSSGPE